MLLGTTGRSGHCIIEIDEHDLFLVRLLNILFSEAMQVLEFAHQTAGWFNSILLLILLVGLGLFFLVSVSFIMLIIFVVLLLLLIYLSLLLFHLLSLCSIGLTLFRPGRSVVIILLLQLHGLWYFGESLWMSTGEKLFRCLAKFSDLNLECGALHWVF